MQPPLLELAAKFDGATFEEEKDGSRLRKQLMSVRDWCLARDFVTLAEISEGTGYPEPSVSARLRDLRKEKFGSWSVERRRRTTAQFEYRVRP